jgi:predicted nucleotidyltransferase
MKDIVAEVSKIFTRENIDFIVIGALARDIFFEEKNIKLDIKTKDVDFAILVKNWDEFEKIKKLLKDEKAMTQDPKKSYRLFLGNIPIDLIPFGEIAEPGATVNWPGSFRARMKVMGFKEAFDCAVDINLNSTIVKVIIPEMLVALKLSSWSLSSGRGKDAMDIKLVLENVKTLCPDLDNDFHEDRNESLLEKYVNDEEGFWISTLGARIQVILNGNDLSSYLKNMVQGTSTMNSFLRDMNEGNVPDQETEESLRKMLGPLIDGLLL